MKFTNRIRGFNKLFWASNTMELFERWAYYGIFLVIALYLTGPKETGALEFTQSQKGWLMGIVTAVLYFLPLFTGAIADRIGYKKSLIASQIILSTGYAMLGYFTSFHGVFIAFLYVAIGAALFKPIIAATIAKTTTKETSSLGFGIYYMIINIGGFIGPAIASKLREHDWKFVFIGSALAICVNIIILFIFYKEPIKEEKKEPLGATLKTIAKNSFHVFGDLKLVFLLIIIIGFWSVFWQLYYTIPNFIDQWANTSPVYSAIAHQSSFLAHIIGNGKSEISPEMIVNIDAACIILFQIIVSNYSSRLKPLYGILAGLCVNSFAMFLAVYTANVWLIMLSIAIAAFGEMMSSPRIIEYLGRIAPEGRTAAYIGSSYMPMAIGSIIAGYLSGSVYKNLSDKFSMLRKEFVSLFPSTPVPKGNTELMTMFTQKTGMSVEKVNQLLWVKYQPYQIAYIFLSIGVLTAVLLVIYDRFLIKEK